MQMYEIVYSSYKDFKYSYSITIQAENEQQALENFKQTVHVKKLYPGMKINGKILNAYQSTCCSECGKKLRRNSNHTC